MKLRPAFLLELAVNLLLPWLAYRLAAPHWGETGGLIASAVPPVIWSLVELARFRRVDACAAAGHFARHCGACEVEDERPGHR